jgi:hypothetical protein
VRSCPGDKVVFLVGTLASQADHTPPHRSEFGSENSDQDDAGGLLPPQQDDGRGHDLSEEMFRAFAMSGEEEQVRRQSSVPSVNGVGLHRYSDANSRSSCCLLATHSVYQRGELVVVHARISFIHNPQTVSSQSIIYL